MSRSYQGGHDFFEDRGAEQPRDLVLGTTALLSIFFAVAIVCAVCFGFGYSRGHEVPGSIAKQRPEPRPLGGNISNAAEAVSGPLPTSPLN